jgi:hypothetical protein
MATDTVTTTPQSVSTTTLVETSVTPPSIQESSLSYEEIVSTLALVTALVALVWNIIRDLVSDRVRIHLSLYFGEMGNIKDSSTGLFAGAGSLLPEHKFDNPGMFVGVTNIGRKPVVVSGLGGKYKKGAEFFIAVEGSSKMLQPYETLSKSVPAKLDFIEKIHKDEVEKIWVTDTKKKRWLLSSKEWKRLKETADYIALGKHL